MRNPLHGLVPIARKEFVHLARDPATVFFALLIPAFQLLMFGFALNMNVRNVSTVVFDQSASQRSRELIEKFKATDTFHVTEFVGSDEDLYAAIRQARAPVGLKIPYDYAERLAQGRNVTLQLLVDGSDSTVSGAAVNAFNGLMLVENQRLMGNLQLVGAVTRPILDGRPVVLYNPATRSPNFFIPGMVAVLPQIMVILLVAMAIVRERERGTLEQLRMTPVEPLGVMVGKALPYFLLGFGEVCLILTMMRIVFSVPVNGNVGLLLLLTIPQLAAILGLGLVISTRAGTQAEAFQMTMGTMLPSIFLSGYIFPINNMPLTFQVVSQVIPTTHYINITRGVILRGAGFWDLWPSAAVLCVMGIVLIAIAARRFQKGV